MERSPNGGASGSVARSRRPARPRSGLSLILRTSIVKAMVIGIRLHGGSEGPANQREGGFMGRLTSAVRISALALAVAGLSLGLAACGDDDDGGGGEESLDLVIGDSVPLSGDLADFGPPGDKAAQIAIEELNAAIEDAGVDHSVELVTEDNCGGADQQCAVQAARKMVDSDGASCIAGAWASADTIPTAESVAIPEEVLLISPASTSDEITGLDDDGLVNRTSPPDSFQGPTLADFIEQELG